MVNGTAGNDLIHVSGDGIVAPPGFTDIPLATAFDDTLSGLGGADLIYGGGGADLIDGGDGNDSLVGGAGADTLIGGAGIDIVVYGGTVGVSVNLDTGRGFNGDAEGDVISGVENLLGSGFGDAFYGSAAANMLSGADGDDSLYGKDGNDTLVGGNGGDFLQGGAGADRLDGGSGIDTIDYNGAAGVTVDLSTGRCSGGEAQGDVISGIENVQGTDGFNDTLTGSAVANKLSGYGGNDILSGLGGDDHLEGGAGDDVLRGGAGADLIDGGAGVDLLSFFGAATAVTVDLFSGHGYGGDAEGDTYSNIENVNGGLGADVIIGSAVANVLNGYEGDDRLLGRDGDDSLAGGAGDDFLQGGAGADRLEGSAGTDTVDYNGNAGVTIDLGTGACSGGEAQGDVLSGIENVQGTDSDGDILTGSSVANLLRGYGGNDVLSGLGGSDTLIGDAGSDTLRGGDGDDFLHVGAGADVMDGGAGRDTMVFDRAMVADWQSGVLDADIAGDSWISWEVIQGSDGDDRIRTNNWGYAVELRGGAGNDVLAAGVDGAIGDTLAGEDGSDSLSGGGGDDVLRGGAGADALDGGAGSDTASYFTSAAGVSVSLTTGLGTGGEAQGDTLSGIENLSGSQRNDSLVGNSGANVLQGWGGNDVLTGADGQDTLTGGTGADRFVYGSAAQSPVGAGADRITDFSHAQGDRIDLSAIDANLGAAGNQAFSFIGTGLYTGVAGQLRYAASGGVTTIAGDLNGDKVSDFHITLTGNLSLVAADFVL